MKYPVSSSRTKRKESEAILERSTVFREFQKEKHEINKLKWLESEKTGKDIGYQRALFMWARKHSLPYRAARLKRLNSGRR